VGLEPLATTLRVILLALDRTTRTNPLPKTSLEPLRPEAPKLPIDYGLDLQRTRVHDHIVLAEVVVAENKVALDIGAWTPTGGRLPMNIGDALRRAE
jgi:hypothetical protein